VAETGVEPSHDAAEEMARLFKESAPGLWRAVFVYSGGRRAVADDAVAEAFARAIAYRNRIRFASATDTGSSTMTHTVVNRLV
jgi:DNA-directed RNA polymerase specialized sigma24 family protein